MTITQIKRNKQTRCINKEIERELSKIKPCKDHISFLERLKKNYTTI